MIIEIKRFEDMTAQEQREHLLDILVDGNNGNVDLEELRKVFLKRHRTKKTGRDYFTCQELAELVGMSADTVRKMFRNETGILKKTTSARGRKSYTTMRISRKSAKRKFHDLEI